MDFYIRTIKENNYVLSEPYNTLEEAETKLQHLHKKSKPTAKIIKIPEVKNGLNLFREGKYYRTIVGSSKYVYFLDNVNKPMDICDVVLKEHLQNWYVKEILDGIETYSDDIEFKDVKDISGYVNDDIKNYDEDE